MVCLRVWEKSGVMGHVVCIRYGIPGDAAWISLGDNSGGMVATTAAANGPHSRWSFVATTNNLCPSFLPHFSLSSVFTQTSISNEDKRFLSPLPFPLMPLRRCSTSQHLFTFLPALLNLSFSLYHHSLTSLSLSTTTPHPLILSLPPLLNLSFSLYHHSSTSDSLSTITP